MYESIIKSGPPISIDVFFSVKTESIGYAMVPESWKLVSRNTVSTNPHVSTYG